MWTTTLDSEQTRAILDLAGRAEAADGVAPLNEEAHFALRDDSAAHLLAVRDGVLAGYLQWQTRHSTAQLVVDPARRRAGIATRLHQELLDRAAATGEELPGVWAFGDLPAARGFADARQLTAERGLLIMSRPLAGASAPAPREGVRLRGYRSTDAAELLEVNATAFAHHPEQGSLDAAGLAARMAEPWFDPAGLILGFDAEGLAGFHWTKRVDDHTGEVYVVAIAPRAQGRGYGRLLLEAGLAHLAAQGLDTVVLYVDSAEVAPVRMYESAGFRIVHRDVLYAQRNQEQE